MDQQNDHEFAPNWLVIAAALVAAIGLMWLLGLRNSGDSSEVSTADRVQPTSATASPEAANAQTEQSKSVVIPSPSVVASTIPPIPTAIPTPEPTRPATAVPRELPTTLPTPLPTVPPPPTPVVGPAPVFTAPLLMMNTKMGTGSSEFSGVALNELENRLVIVDDEDRMFEFALDAAGLPITPPLRTIGVLAGAGDLEGIAWVGGSQYVLAHEDDGWLTVIDLARVSERVDDEHVVERIDTGIRERDGNGLEGVAPLPPTVGTGWVVVDERPPTIAVLTTGQSPSRSELSLAGISDASDIWIDGQGAFWIVSDESRVVQKLAFDDQGSLTVLSEISLQLPDGDFDQAEGIVVSSDGSRLYVVGESPDDDQYSLGVWNVVSG